MTKLKVKVVDAPLATKCKILGCKQPAAQLVTDQDGNKTLFCVEHYSRFASDGGAEAAE